MKREPSIVIVDDLETKRKLLCKIFNDYYKKNVTLNGEAGSTKLVELQKQNNQLNAKIKLYADIMTHGTKMFIFELNVSNDEAKCYSYLINHSVEIYRLKNFLCELEKTKKIQKEYIQGLRNSLDFAKQNEIVNAYDFLAISEENSVKWFRMVYASGRNENGVIETVIGRIFDVGIHKQSYEDLSKEKPYIKELEERAKYDYITKLLNRATFENLFEEQDYFDEKKTALILIDVDNFKGINDKYGHLIGDKVLAMVADIFRVITKKTDLVGRLGGDEFVIFIEYENIAEVEAIALEISSQATKIGKILFGGKDSVTLSAGIALNTFGELDFIKLYDKADKLLYGVKNCTKNCFKIE